MDDVVEILEEEAFGLEEKIKALESDLTALRSELREAKDLNEELVGALEYYADKKPYLKHTTFKGGKTEWFPVVIERGHSARVALQKAKAKEGPK